MIIDCPECSGNVSDKAAFCPHCGFPFTPSVITTPGVSTQRKGKNKRRKLPNGFGSVKKLSGKRKKPFAAYPPVTEFSLNGSPVSVPAIGYFEDWQSAYDALSHYNRNPYDLRNATLTFAEMYELFFNSKYVDNKKRTYSKATVDSTRAAFKNCSSIHGFCFKQLRKADLQKVLDECPLKHSSLELIVNLYRQMYKFALENDYIEKDYSQFVTINKPDDDIKGIPFTDGEISLLWNNLDVPYVDTILILIYTGFRISEFLNIEIDLDKRYFKGGIKTAAGKNRIVPIHDSIFPLIEKYNGDTFLKTTTGTYRKLFYSTINSLGIGFTTNGQPHTPHDCRHTFSWLCDKFKVDSFSKHLLMGHSLSGDVESSVYGHRTLEELTSEIAKIKV